MRGYRAIYPVTCGTQSDLFGGSVSLVKSLLAEAGSSCAGAHRLGVCLESEFLSIRVCMNLLSRPSFLLPMHGNPPLSKAGRETCRFTIHTPPTHREQREMKRNRLVRVDSFLWQLVPFSTTRHSASLMFPKLASIFLWCQKELPVKMQFRRHITEAKQQIKRFQFN